MGLELHKHALPSTRPARQDGPQHGPVCCAASVMPPQELVRREGIATAASIHSPSPTTFALFDSILLLQARPQPVSAGLPCCAHSAQTRSRVAHM